MADMDMRGSVERVMESGNAMILDMFVKAHDVLSNHARACVSVSGGADSDVMIDLVERVRDGTGCEVHYVWFDTGLEYEATKRHLSDLERRYGIEILRRKAEKSIPTTCREFGQPFVSKYASEQLERLQRHGFQWEDGTLDELSERYPRCSSALKWWTNSWTRVPGMPGYFDIGRNRWLKEFIMENPPTFPISNRCCEYAKKRVAAQVNAELGVDLELVGVRKAERGVRATIGTCFTAHEGGVDVYRPLYWLSNGDRADYHRIFGLRHSDCYEEWGFTRTGCVGCPFNINAASELEIARQHEPRLVAAVERVFADSYEYTRRYHDYIATREGQGRLF